MVGRVRGREGERVHVCFRINERVNDHTASCIHLALVIVSLVFISYRVHLA